MRQKTEHFVRRLMAQAVIRGVPCWRPQKVYKAAYVTLCILYGA
jgi:hypothetical protein